MRLEEAAATFLRFYENRDETEENSIDALLEHLPETYRSAKDMAARLKSKATGSPII
jgi:hypothetical protein